MSADDPAELMEQTAPSTVGEPLLGRAHPLCLGGNVFGWTVTEAESFEILDAYAAVGGNFVDTADAYSVWAEGNHGGESETIIGRWMASRANRDELIVATKVGSLGGLSRKAIFDGIDGSLHRLATDWVDLYYAHVDDPQTPLEETLRAFDDLVAAGKVRAIGVSNVTAARLTSELDLSDRMGFARFGVIQPLYNLLERDAFEGDLLEVCAANAIDCVPFFGLARGFLTGKYRPGRSVDSRRGELAWGGEWSPRVASVLDALDSAAARHRVPVAAIALAWLRKQPTVRAPIASARTVTQLRELLAMTEVTLDRDDLALLDGCGD